MQDEFVSRAASLDQQLASLHGMIHVEEKRHRLGELESQTLVEGFWDDPDQAQGVMRELNVLKQDLDLYDEIKQRLGELSEFIELDDDELAEDIATRLDALAQLLDQLETSHLFEGKFDNRDALLAIHAGTGGVDAQDWGAILERMYLRYAESKGWKVTILDHSPGEEAGIKSATLEVTGERVYGHLKAEHGVHRLVRLSPFNAKNSRETSFCLVEVLPVMPRNEELTIDDKELRVDVFRSSGHGGQSVNTTDSAVRLTHLPTGIVVTCQNERSQLQNKQRAMQILQARLQKLQEEAFDAQVSKTKGEHKQGSWGNQIRSYVMQPYTMVKDHRTEHETSNVDGVLDGELEGFVLARLKQQAHARGE